MIAPVPAFFGMTIGVGAVQFSFALLFSFSPYFKQVTLLTQSCQEAKITFRMLLFAAIVIIGILWLTALTALFLKLSNHYNNLIKGTHASTLQDTLTALLTDVIRTKKDIET